jgi:hypothetical protein
MNCKIVKCYNKTCYNFTTNHDLAGTWCCNECFIESENPELERLTRKELLDMKVKYDWDLDEFEKKELEALK